MTEANGLIDESTSLRQARRTAARVIEGRAVVVVIDRQVVHSLNPVGTLVWTCADGRSLGAIVDEIEREFDVDRGTALADARKFVAELRELGAIDIEPEPR